MRKKMLTKKDGSPRAKWGTKTRHGKIIGTPSRVALDDPGINGAVKLGDRLQAASERVQTNIAMITDLAAQTLEDVNVKLEDIINKYKRR